MDSLEVWQSDQNTRPSFWWGGGGGVEGGGGLNILYGECELRDKRNYCKQIELSICAQFRDCRNIYAKDMSNICAKNV